MWCSLSAFHSLLLLLHLQSDCLSFILSLSFSFSFSSSLSRDSSFSEVFAFKTLFSNPISDSFNPLPAQKTSVCVRNPFFFIIGSHHSGQVSLCHSFCIQQEPFVQLFPVLSLPSYVPKSIHFIIPLFAFGWEAHISISVLSVTSPKHHL